MERQDKDLAWMLRFENIAWYEDGKVRILDRRIYPIEVKFVVCNDHREVACAIRDMVTQSAGPYVAAAMGMALAAHECRGRSEAEQLEYLREAAYTLSHARPTTSVRMEKVTAASYEAARRALAQGASDATEAVMEHTIEQNNERYYRIGIAAGHLADLFPDRGAVMTQCFGETIVGQMLKEARLRGKDIRLFCPETRPYFQGSRLTASVAVDMGFDVTVITDNMPAAVMKNEGIDIFTSAADAICMDGYVVNKVGTYQIAIVAKYHGVPYYVSGAPDSGHPTIDTVKIEMRDPDFVLQAMGTQTANIEARGYYPSFDITPPELVTGVVTDKGVLSPYSLSDYAADPDDFLV
ncbi:MAG: s-methyl-5-thioribose-1-phosphate isomerase [Clostridiales bacterium]|nr:s-methyl-5-thioribose-1-phosphate isomerase [Clostridiales bacterium]